MAASVTGDKRPGMPGVFAQQGEQAKVASIVGPVKTFLA
jgi:hypothetical protein